MDDIHGEDSSMALRDLIGYAIEADETSKKSQSAFQYNQNFQERDMRPFLSLVPARCSDESWEKILSQFMDWLIHCRTQSFLYTFEPKPTLTHLSLGRCPYFHTTETAEEKLLRARELEKEGKIRIDLEEFVRKRLTLIQRLITVYKKAKIGIESEYRKNLSTKDPYCEYKKRMASKKIVDMMIKQFALEYLYLKSMKIKNEIETINCLLIDTNRSRHLKNLHKYTLRTAEKLRCLLEKECTDDNQKSERYFEEKTLRDMARMYMNEIERMAASLPSVGSPKWSGEQNWDSGSSGDEVVPENKSLADFFETNLASEDIQMVTAELKSDQMENKTDQISSDNPTLADEKQDLSPGKESKSSPEEDDENLTGDKSDNIIFLDEESDKHIINPEESYNIIEDIKKEILKSGYWLEESPPPEVEKFEPDVRIAQLETNKEEFKLTEAFKRELWLADEFYYFTTVIKPELKGKFKLVHTDNIYDEYLREEGTAYDTRSTLDESSIESNLNRCFIYLGEDKIGIRMPTVIDKKRSSEENYVNSMESDLVSSSKSVESKAEVFKDDVEKKLLDTIDEPSSASLPTAEETIKNGSYLIDGSSLHMGYTDYTNENEINDIVSVNSFKVDPDQVTSNTTSLEPNKSILQDVSYSREVYPSEVDEKNSVSSRGGVSIPSFAGTLPDPLQKYRKCINDGEIGSYEKDSVDDFLFQEINLNALFSIVDSSDSNGSSAKSYNENQIGNKQSSSSTQSIQQSSRVSVSRISERVSERVLTSKVSKCLPTLNEVLDHFTRTLKDQSSLTFSEIQTVETEEIEEEAEEYDWKELMAIKWRSASRDTNKNESTICKFDTTEFIEQLRKSNIQFMRNHPEMYAVITLIIREFSMKKPEHGFIKFIRDTVFNKNFAKQVSSYLVVNNKAYRRKHRSDDDRCFYQPAKNLVNDTSNMFTFDKPTLESWQEWGIDYRSIYEKYGPNLDQEQRSVSKVTEDTLKEKQSKDSWDLTRLMDNLDDSKLKRKKGFIAESCWAKFIKSVERGEEKDLHKEINRVNALSDEVGWSPSPDKRSECQKMFIKRRLTK